MNDIAPTPEEMAEMLRPIGNSESLAVERMHVSEASSNLVYRVTDRGGIEVFLRVNRNPAAFKGTKDTIGVLRSLGLPVPRLIHIDMSLARTRFAWMLQKALPGRDLRFELAQMTAAQMSQLAVEIIRIQELVMRLPKGRGFGWVGPRQKGPFQSWNAIVERDLIAATTNARDYGRPDFGPRVERFSIRLQEDLLMIRPTPFLDDLTTKNVLVTGGQLTGIVDLDWLCYGDPLYQLALAEVAVIADVGEPGRFYIEELKRHWPSDSFDASRLLIYLCIHAMSFLVGTLTNRESDARLVLALENWLK